MSSGPAAASAQPCQDVYGARKERRPRVATAVVSFGDSPGQRSVVAADVANRHLRDLSTRRPQIEAAYPVSLRVRPEPIPKPKNLCQHRLRVDCGTTALAGHLPAVDDGAAVDNRVIEINEDSVRQLHIQHCRVRHIERSVWPQ